MNQDVRSWLPVLLTVVAVGLGQSSCETEPIEGSGKVYVGSPAAVLLPPGHPGVVSGSTLLYPVYSDFPTIHYANCFAGVENSGQIGIGTAAGYSRDFVGSVMLPVNLNLGGAVLGSYRVTIEIADPAVEILDESVAGSYAWLSTDDCRDRCNSSCTSYPRYYQHQYDPAPGFEDKPTVTVIATGITIAAVDADPAHPTTGIVNLANVPIRIVGDLPAAGGVPVTLTVDLLHDPLDLDIGATPLSGVVIQNLKLQ